MASGLSPIFPSHLMFNFSASHLFPLSRTEYRSCSVLLMQDRDTNRVYRHVRLWSLLPITKGMSGEPSKLPHGRTPWANNKSIGIASAGLSWLHRHRIRRDAGSTFGGKSESEYALPSRNGAPKDAHNYRRRHLQPLAARLGLAGLTVQVHRRSFATLIQGKVLPRMPRLSFGTKA